MSTFSEEFEAEQNQLKANSDTYRARRESGVLGNQGSANEKPLTRDEVNQMVVNAFGNLRIENAQGSGLSWDVLGQADVVRIVKQVLNGATLTATATSTCNTDTTITTTTTVTISI